MTATSSNSSTSLQLVFGGERTREIILDVDSVLERWKAELEGHDHSATPTSPITLVIRHRSWSIEAMERVAPFIESIAPRIVALEADDMIAKQETSIALQVFTLLVQALRNASQLTIVNFNDNALGIRSLEILKVLLTRRLVTLKLSNTGVDSECMRILREALLGANDNHAHANDVVCALQHLVLSRNTIGPEGAEHVGAILPHCPDVISFIYNGARPQEEGSTYIVNGFREQLELKRQRQELQENGEAAETILALQELNLTECTLGDTVDRPLGTFCQVLMPAMPNLRELHLGDCSLELVGLNMLINVLTTVRPPLEALSLSNVGEIGRKGGRRLASFLSNFTSSLKFLSLEGNSFGWRGLEALVPFFNADDSQLRTIKLSCNELGPRAAEQLLSIRTDVPWEQLHLEENFFEDEELQQTIKSHFKGVVVSFGDEQGEGDEEEEGDEDEDEEEDEDDEEVEEDNDKEVEEALSQQVAQLDL